MAKIVLKVNGLEYGGWKTASVTRSIESVSGGFELSVSEKWAGQSTPWPIRQGDECSLELEGQVVVTGRIDSRRLGYNATDHSISVSGRDAAGVLVDCAADVGNKWEFKNLSVLEFAKKITKPYGIPVAVQAGLTLPKAPSKLSIEPGDRAFEAIERACRTAALLPVSDGRGGMVLTRAGSGRSATALVERENILSASAEYDSAERFRTVKVYGQHKGTDEASGKAVGSIRGEAQDPEVRWPERVLVVRAEGNVTRDAAKQRAKWEVTVRRARAVSVVVTVHGWTKQDGKLWTPNELVSVKSPKLELYGIDMLISQVRYSTGASGTTTELTLRPRDAFMPEPLFLKNKTGKNSAPWPEIEGGV